MIFPIEKTIKLSVKVNCLKIILIIGAWHWMPNYLIITQPIITYFVRVVHMHALQKSRIEAILCVLRYLKK